jgi:hypothetical protein
MTCTLFSHGYSLYACLGALMLVASTRLWDIWTGRVSSLGAMREPRNAPCDQRPG